MPHPIVHVLLLLGAAIAQPVPKTTTSQFPYGSCGAKTKAQLYPSISPYQSPLWVSSSEYITLNMSKQPCRDRGLDCGGVPCVDLCNEARSRVDAFHFPLDGGCLLSARVSARPCTALVSNNLPGAARYRAGGAWTPVSMDINSCDGTVTQARVNTKGIDLSGPWLQLSFPASLFNCTWRQACRSATAYSAVPFCAVAPYINSGAGAHMFCPVLPSIVLG